MGGKEINQYILKQKSYSHEINPLVKNVNIFRVAMLLNYLFKSFFIYFNIIFHTVSVPLVGPKQFISIMRAWSTKHCSNGVHSSGLYIYNC